MAIFIILAFACTISVVFVFLAGIRIGRGGIVVGRPANFRLYLEMVRHFRGRLQQSEMCEFELRRVYLVGAIAPWALLLAQLLAAQLG